MLSEVGVCGLHAGKRPTLTPLTLKRAVPGSSLFTHRCCPPQCTRGGPAAAFCAGSAGEGGLRAGRRQPRRLQALCHTTQAPPAA